MRRKASNGLAQKRANKTRYNRTDRGRFTRLRFSVRKHKRTFDLEFSDYEKIVSQPCVYCGVHKEVYPGSYWTDRIDSSKGYLKNNVVPCCPVCNGIKGEFFTQKEAARVIKYAKKIAPDIFSGKRKRRIRALSKRHSK